MNRNSSKLIAAILFLLSGATGLIYQVVWFKYLHLFLGNTTYAQMIVLTAFLGGLAIGNHYFGKSAERIKNTLRVYGILEIFIAAYCFAYPILISFTGNLFISISSSIGIENNITLINILRFVISILILLAPTIAMGGTLPLLSNFFVEKLTEARRDVAILYFLNSFGAVVGIFFSGFILIRTFGLEATIYSAAFLNLIIGVVAFFISKNQSSPELNLQEEALDNTTTVEISKHTYRKILVVAFLSGFAALLYELVWVRLLINFFGSSTYAFSIMLLAFISGITLGGWIISKSFFDKYNKLKLIVLFQLVIAFSTMCSLLLYDRLPYYLWHVSSIFARTPAAFNYFLFSEFVLTFSLMLIPTVFMGMTLPACTELFSRSSNKIGFSVGKIFSINTVGTVLGVVCTALIFIPLFGIKLTFELGMLANIIGALLLVFSISDYSKTKKLVTSGLTLFLFVLYLISFTTWNKPVILGGVFRSLSQTPPESFDLFQKMFLNENILYYKEGSAATVAVTQSKIDTTRKRLLINGKADASSGFDMPTQILLGQIPMLLHKNPQNVFIVGLGSGTTAGSVLTHDPQKVVCAEISKEVIEASKYFENENNNCLSDSRLKIINEDALSLLKSSKEKFDVIISEPSNPWIAGIGNLFSQEYFNICKQKLTEEGMMVQWFHLYEINDDVLKLVLNTFNSVFENAQIWNPVVNDIILVGTKNKMQPDFSLLKKKFEEKKIFADLNRVNINNPFTFLSCQLNSSKGVFLMANKEPINKETHPKLEFMAPEAFYLSSTTTFLYQFDERLDTVSNGLLIKDYIKKHAVTIPELQNTVSYHTNRTKVVRFAYGLAKHLNEIDTSALSKKLFVDAKENFTLDKNRYWFFEKLHNDLPTAKEIKKDYLDAAILEKINSTTFLHVFSLKKEAGQLLLLQEKDSVSQTRINIQLAKSYFYNGEYESAHKHISLAENLILNNITMKQKINIDNYLYYNSMISLYRKDFERVFVNYMALTNKNSSYSNLNILRRTTQWVLNNKEVL